MKITKEEFDAAVKACMGAAAMSKETKEKITALGKRAAKLETDTDTIIKTVSIHTAVLAKIEKLLSQIVGAS